jgi:hypothetical protein
MNKESFNKQLLFEENSILFVIHTIIIIFRLYDINCFAFRSSKPERVTTDKIEVSK